MSEQAERIEKARRAYVAAIGTGHEGDKKSALESIVVTCKHDAALRCYLTALDSRRDRDTEGRAMRLYFIQSGEDGPIKIGFSVRPDERMADLQVGNPSELKMLGAFEVATIGVEAMEAGWHYVFWAARIRGEWFKPIPKLLRSIEDWKNGIDLGCMEPVDETDC